MKIFSLINDVEQNRPKNPTPEEQRMLNHLWSTLAKGQFESKSYLSADSLDVSGAYIYQDIAVVDHPDSIAVGVVNDTGVMIKRYQLTEPAIDQAKSILMATRDAVEMVKVSERPLREVISVEETNVLNNLREEIAKGGQTEVRKLQNGTEYKVGQMGVFVPKGLFSQPMVSAFDQTGNGEARADFEVEGKVSRAALKEILSGLKKGVKVELAATSIKMKAPGIA